MLPSHSDPRTWFWRSGDRFLYPTADSVPRGSAHVLQWSADSEANRAFVFVHGSNILTLPGWRAGALDTWGDAFFVALSNDERARHFDFYSFGYETLKSRAPAPARRLIFLLDALEEQSLDFPETYEEVVLVAHSTGAIVLRLALLDAIDEHRAGNPHPGLEKVRTVYFAPAHCGLPPLAYLRSLRLGEFGRVARALYDLRHPSALDCLADGPMLRSLKERTEACIGLGFDNCLVASKVVHAETDPLVHPTRFVSDPAASIYWGRTHRSVCRADHEFTQPLETLLGS